MRNGDFTKSTRSQKVQAATSGMLVIHPGPEVDSEVIRSAKKLRNGRFELKWVGGTIETNLTRQAASSKFDRVPFECMPFEIVPAGKRRSTLARSFAYEARLLSRPRLQ